MANQDSFQKAAELIKTGNYESAKTILYKVIQVDPDDDRAWVAMYYCVPSLKDKRLCLEKALSINPGNNAAKKLSVRLEKQPVSVPALIPEPDENGNYAEPAKNPSEPAPRSHTMFYIVILVCVLIILGIVVTLILKSL
jgi:hypothetical protein